MRPFPLFLAGLLILFAFTAARDSKAHPGHGHSTDTVLILRTTELKPGQSYALERCPRGFELTDFDVISWYGDPTRQRRTRRGWKWTYASSDSRSVRVDWYRPTRRYPYKPGVVHNRSNVGVSFDSYCQRRGL